VWKAWGLLDEDSTYNKSVASQREPGTISKGKDQEMDATRLLIGWREWVSLPGLGLPAIKAKADTGARTSSLHAFDISTYSERGKLKVRFRIHPLQARDDIVVNCHALIVDHRYVSDSGGHREKRYVIETPLRIGELEYPIEITLANRESMAHRMLIGRAAMKPLVIDPNHVFLLGRPEKVVRLYRALRPSTARGAKPESGRTK
jgi:hypothetical protein